MKKLIILYENQSLTNDEIKNVPEKLYYNQKVIKVGYFYESRSDKHFFILPKLLDGILIEEKELYNFVILFFKSLKRINNEENKCNFPFIESNLKDKEFTHLEAIISLIDFYKKNKEVLFSYAQQILLEHQSSSKTNWNKTIFKTIPFISNKKPIYISFVNNKKIIDKDEKLLKIFYSTIYYLNKEYFLNLTIPDIIKDFFVYSPKEFKRIKKNILKILKLIKYKYFSDKLKQLYNILENYYNIHKKSKKILKNEFILTKDYHIIFEKMVDSLISDKNQEIEKLKNQKDGKLVDHLFLYNSLIDKNKKIYYIADSKYYTDDKIGEYSIYKQVTYARNIINYHIEKINNSTEYEENILYRDDLTEGYNISPNFFIQGYIPYKKIKSINYCDIKWKMVNDYKFYHFPNRLFDRDTFYILHYKVNYLYILKSFALNKNINFNFKEKIREDFIKFLNSKYNFYSKIFNSDEKLNNFVTENFKKLIGKVFVINIEKKFKLIIALEKTEKEKLNLDNFKKFELE